MGFRALSIVVVTYKCCFLSYYTVDQICILSIYIFLKIDDGH